MPYWRGKSILHLGVRWIMLATAVQFAFYAHPLFANPAGASVVNGAVNMQTSGNTLAITASDRSIINWQGFSIGAGETTQFIQPTVNASVLNRVTSGDSSQIMGALQANGQVYLINPNGVFIGNGATINVGSFLASTANVSDESFMRGGNLTFSEASGAGIINRGTITANHGDVFLLAKTVENSGTIQAAQGTVGLMAGTQFFLKKDETGAVKVKVDSSSVPGVKAGTGVANSGVIEAMQAQLEAQGNVYALAINQSGIIRATGVSRDASGIIVLSAPGGMIRNTGTMLALNRDGSGGRLSISGQDVSLSDLSILTAAGTGGSELAVGGQIEIAAVKDAIVAGRLDVTAGGSAKGGRMVVTGRRVGVFGGKLDASGGTGGGEILLGGDYQGLNPLVRNAETMVMSSDSSIAADATVAGDGGKVILWSNEYTGFYGDISAKGGVVSGNGGFVETSSKENLQAFGLVNASAVNGKGGEWLLDPYNIAINSSASANVSGSGTSLVTPTGSPANVLNTSISGSLNGGTSVTVSTGNATGTEAGNITISAPIAKTLGAAATLTLNANGSIDIQTGGAISSTTGTLGLTLNAGFANGGDSTVVSTSSVTIGDTIGLNGGNLTINNVGTGSITLNANIGGATTAAVVNANLTSGGAINQALGVFTATGTTTLAAGSGQAINLSTGGTPNNFGTVVVNSGGAVTLSEADAITFGAVTASGNFNLTSGGAATFNNAVNLGQTGGSFNATITGAANINNTITANGVTISPTAALTISSAGTILSGGAVSLGGSSISTGANVTTTADAVTYLANTTLTAPGIVVNSAGGDITFSGTLNAAQSLGLTAGVGNILFSGAVGGVTPLTTVTVNSANNVTASGAFSAASLSLPALTGSAIFNGNLNLTTGLTTTAGAYNISILGATQTIASATTFNNTGTLTLGDGGDTINFTGGVAATAPSSKTLNGTITAAGTGVINLGTTSVTVGGTTTVGGTSTGAITLGSATLANGVTLTVGTGIANAITLGSVSGTASGAVSNLTVTSTGAVILNGAIGTNIGAVSVSSNPSSLNVNSTITGSSAITLTAGAGGITTATYSVTDATISSTASSVSLTTSAGGNINLNSPVNTIGGTTVTLNSAGILIIGLDGDITSDGNVVLTGTSGIQTAGGVATSADAVNFNSATTLTGALDVNTGSTGGNITFSSTLTGAGQNLNLTAGTAGNVVFTGAVGAARLGAITINSANDVTAAAITAASFVQTTGQGTTTFSGAQNYNTSTGLNVVTDTIALSAAVTTTSGGIVTLNANNLGGVAVGTLTIGASVNSAGAVTLTGATGLTIAAAGDITSGEAVNLTATSGISTAGDITTTGDVVNYNSATTLTGGVLVDTTSAGGSPAGATVTFGSTLDGANSLGLTAGTGGNVVFTGAVGATTRLGAITINSAKDVTAIGIRATSLAQTTGSGTTFLNGAVNVNGVGSVNISNGTINLGSTLASTAGGSGAVTLNALTGSLTVGGAITSAGGATLTGATSLTQSAAISSTGVGANVAMTATTGTLSIGAGVGTAAGGAVTVNAAAGALTIAAAGDINSGGVVNLTGATGISTAGDVTTTADLVNYNSATTLTGNVLVDTTSASGSPAGATVTFANTLNGAQSLGLTAGTAGNVVFTGLVGNTTPLGALTISSAANVTANGIRAASFIQTTGSGTTTLNLGDFTTGTDQAVGTTASGGISVSNDAVVVNNRLDTAAGGIVSLTGEVGALTIASAGDIASDGAVNLTAVGGITTSGDVTTTADVINYNAALTMSGPITLNSGGGNILFSSTLAGGNSDLTIAAGTAAGTTTFTGAVSGMGDGIGAAIAINSTGLTWFKSTVAGGSGIVSSPGAGLGSTRFDQNVTLTAGDTGSSFDGAVQFDGLSWSGFGGLTVSGPATLSTAALNITSNNGNVVFGSTLNGAQDLGLTAGTGSVSFNGIVGGSTPLGTVTLTSAAGVTAANNFSAGTVTLTSVTGTASFAGNLVLTTGLSVGGGVNNVSMVGGGTIAGATTFNNTGTVTIGDASGDSSTFTAGVVATAPTAVNIAGTIAANTGASVITLGDAGTPVSVTATSVLGGAATGAISLGNVTLANGVTLTVGTGFATTVNLLAVSDGVNTGNLVVTANTMNFTGGVDSIAVGGTVLLQGQTAATTIGVAGAAGTLQVTGGNIAAIADGATSITIGNSAQTGLVTVDAVGFVDPVVIRSSAVGGNVTVAGAITATDTVTLQGDTLAVNAGVTAIGSDVVLQGGGVGVTLTGAPILTTATPGTGIDSGDITISAVGSGTINLDAASTLTTIGASNTIVGTNENGGAGGNVTLTTQTGLISALALIDTSGGDASGGLAGCDGGAGGNVVIGTTAGPISLADITTSGGDALAGASLNGGNAGSVTVSSSSGNTVTLNSSDINANGGLGFGTGISGTGSSIVFENPVLLAVGLTTMTTTGSTGGDITFEDALDGGQSLTLDAGTGNILFSGIVGATPLTTVTVNSASSTIANLAFSAGTVALIAPGTTSFNGNLNLTTALTTAAGAYNISTMGAANTIAGATTFNNLGTLTIGQAGGTSTFTGGLVATAPSGVTLLGTVATANSTMTLGDAGTGVTLGANTVLNSGSGAINVNGALAGGGFGLTLQGGLGTGTVTIGGAISNLGSLTITAAAYDVLVTGGGTINGATSFLNTGSVTIGGAGLTTTFTGGLVATAPSGVTLLGTVATANTTMTLGDAGTGVTLGAATTLKSGTGVINVNGALTGGANGLTLQDATAGSTGAVNITGGIVSLGSLTTFGGLANYAVSITGAANTIAGVTTFNNIGSLTIGQAGGTSTFTGGLVATAPSSKSIAGTISALGTGVIDLGTTPVTVTANTTVGGSSTGTITLGNATIANGATLTVGTGIANAITMGTVSGVAGGTVSNLAINTTGAASVGVIGTDMGTVTASAGALSLADVTTSGAITVTADGITPTGIITSTAAGDITIRPLTAGTAIGIGTGVVSGGLDLGSGLADVFTSGRVIIGSTALTGSGSGAITIGTVDLSDTGYTGFSLLSQNAAATFNVNSVLTLPMGTDIRFQLGTGDVDGTLELGQLNAASFSPNLVSKGGTLSFVSVGSVSLYGNVGNLQASVSSASGGGLVYLNQSTLNVIGSQTAAGEMLIGSVNGNLNLSSQLTGTKITAYAAQNFNNTFGSTAINLQGGRGLVYSTSPNDNTPKSANGGLNGFGAAYLVQSPNVLFGDVGQYAIANPPSGNANLMAYSDPLPVSQLDAVTLNQIVQTEAYLAAVPLTGATLPALPRSDVRLGFRAGGLQQRAPAVAPLGQVDKNFGSKGQSAKVVAPGRLKVSQMKRVDENKAVGQVEDRQPMVQPVIRIGVVSLRSSGDYLPFELAEVTMRGIRISQK